MLVILQKHQGTFLCLQRQFSEISRETGKSRRQSGAQLQPSCLTPICPKPNQEFPSLQSSAPIQNQQKVYSFFKSQSKYQLLQSSHCCCQVPYPFFPATLVSFREQLYRKWPTSESLVQIANQRLMAKFQKHPVSPTRAGMTTGFPQEGHFSVT